MTMVMIMITILNMIMDMSEGSYGTDYSGCSMYLMQANVEMSR